MGKILLVSIVIATVVLPLRAASHPSPARALRKAILSIIAFNLLYFLGILYVYPRLPS